MKLTINGQEKTFEETLSVTQLLELWDIDPSHVAVEINLDIVSHDLYGTTHLKADDDVEIVHFIGGG